MLALQCWKQLICGIGWLFAVWCWVLFWLHGRVMQPVRSGNIFQCWRSWLHYLRSWHMVVRILLGVHIMRGWYTFRCI